ncbi:hypothetical protein DRO61_07650 [Candidatus Bathyarchaeota archaeon]|nr:MAG: hypothetical protein DRO61_07650 [Candidatus Bathyarchaeota archaeon]
MSKKDEKLAELEALHGKCYPVAVYLDVDDSSKVANVYLKKLDRRTYTIVNKLLKGDDALKAVEACFKALYVGGDDLSLITESFDALMSAESAVVDLINRKPAELKKN